MTTKEIEKVINNQTHKRLTRALHDKCADIAKTIRGIIYNLQITDIDGYVISTNRSNSGFSEDYLCVDGGSLECSSDYYFAGDYHCYTRSASREQKITFLNRAKDILASLSEMQDDECLRISKVLDNFSD